jgi:hypothetical protein
VIAWNAGYKAGWSACKRNGPPDLDSPGWVNDLWDEELINQAGHRISARVLGFDRKADKYRHGRSYNDGANKAVHDYAEERGE